jgi:hypothetical protein
MVQYALSDSETLALTETIGVQSGARKFVGSLLLEVRLRDHGRAFVNLKPAKQVLKLRIG